MSARADCPQLVEVPAETLRMQVQCEAWGGIAITWSAGELTMLVDVRDAWLAWRGRLVRRVIVGLA